MTKEYNLAGAGSGKTHKVQTEVAARLVEGAVMPENLMVVTFTKKAANELRERITEELLKSQQYDLVARLEEARIGTVNSVCGDLTRQFAFELGLSPEQQVIDDQQSQRLIAEALDKCLSPQETDSLNQLGRAFSVESWQDAVLSIVEKSRTNNITPENYPSLAGKSFAELEALLPGEDTSVTEESLRQKAREFIENAKEFPSPTKGLITATENIQKTLYKTKLTWEDWVSLSKKKGGKKEEPLFESLREVSSRVLHSPAFKRELREFIARIFKAAENVLSEYAEHKAERGLVDFADQELKLLEALALPNVQETLKSRLGFLVVDEFQDTSPVQLALFSQLSELAENTLFVGDIKQAIYGFRGADPALSLSVLKHFESGAGKVGVLPESWRSRPGLVHLANTLFEQPFSPILKPEYVRLKPARNYSLDLPEAAWWHIHGSNESKRASALALAIAEFVRQGYDIQDKATQATRKVRCSDIAILCRGNKEIPGLAEALVRNGVPVACERGGLLETPEVTFALACYRRLIDPSDSLASAEILSFSAGKNAEHWLEHRLHTLDDSASWSDNAHRILENLAFARERANTLSPGETLSLAIQSSGLMDIASAWGEEKRLTDHRLANLQALQEMADEYSDFCRTESSAGTASGFLIWLREKEQRGTDLQAHNPGDAVNVLTYHKSKGLEWPVVVCAGLNKDLKVSLYGVRVETDGAFDWQQPLSGRELRYWPNPFPNQRGKDPLSEKLQATPIWEQQQETEKREELQLLYVGMTRARDHLILIHEGKSTVGKKLDLLNCDLFPFEDGELMLPDGSVIRTINQNCEEPENEAHLPALRERFWLDLNRGITDSERDSTPYFAPPSSAPALEKCSAELVHNFRSRIQITGKPDMASTGDAIHHAMAVCLTNPDVGKDNIQALLNGYVSGNISAAEVLGQAENLQGWIKNNYPEAELYTEIPFTRTLEDERLETGRIDLLLKVRDGWIVIDHKSFPGSQENCLVEAKKYSGQLQAYSQGLENLTGNPVVRSYIHFAVSGFMVEVSSL